TIAIVEQSASSSVNTVSYPDISLCFVLCRIFVTSASDYCDCGSECKQLLRLWIRVQAVPSTRAHILTYLFVLSSVGYLSRLPQTIAIVNQSASSSVNTGSYPDISLCFVFCRIFVTSASDYCDCGSECKQFRQHG
ncbi:hypothetical protein J6590_108068, partial [Homalodisca vitripennis]